MTLDRTSSVGILGAGTMGSGLGVVFANYGCPVSVYDIHDDAMAGSQNRIAGALETLVDGGIIDDVDRDAADARIDHTTDLETAVAGADLMVEAAPEDLSLKQQLFASVSEFAASESILATNTSGLSITEIASTVTRPERFLGTHWFNPPYLVPLVEVIYGEETDDSTVHSVYEFMDAIGKTPIVVNEDIPGFIANRLQFAMDYEAWSLLERGIASSEDIDRAAMAGFGFRLPALGVFTKTDFGGLDVFHSIQGYLMEELDRGTQPSRALADLVEAGDIGLKSGKGVYDWSDFDPSEADRWRDEQLLNMLRVYRELQG